MKKIQLKGKLSLNKETIAKLNDEQMGDVKGGKGVETSLEYGCQSFNQKSCLYTGGACCKDS